MPESPPAEQLNNQGNRLRAEGDIAAAEAAYQGAIAAAPLWSAPHYNLGLLYKYECRWAESLRFNRLATELAPDDEASWWSNSPPRSATGRPNER